MSESGAAPLGGTDFETVRIALKLMSDDPRVPALEALSRIERVVEARTKALSWALDLIDMYDKRMIQLGDPRELVYSDVHLEGKRIAREALGALDED